VQRRFRECQQNLKTAFAWRGVETFLPGRPTFAVVRSEIAVYKPITPGAFCLSLVVQGGKSRRFLVSGILIRIRGS